MSINFTDKKPGDFGIVDAPQSDLQKFIDLYHSVGIELEAVVNEEDVENGYQYLGLNYRTYECVLTTEKMIGECSGFHTNIYFDRDGKFIQQGIWE